VTESDTTVLDEPVADYDDELADLEPEDATAAGVKGGYCPGCSPVYSSGGW